ncbi:DNA topoisomerase IB [Aquabacterium sp. A7-Y]|uniref:DNA topoisomerase IB n=1 Tax=Aquabacterium sp. A7-Y TaxID=1349605 RepID=UPI00223CF15B|nr:DNA topoisomerase IB [Aquabacterium sp. A7-Y]MCW7536320.1 DNA topoisomerase IB [Aquabacterium sp. A7-Y]
MGVVTAALPAGDKTPSRRRAAKAVGAALAKALQPEPVKLEYVTDTLPGLTRVRRGKGFAYLDAEGRPVRDKAELQRIRQLAIPPAYTDVWICPLPEGHLQATGRDARGRKQYRYHPSWHAQRDADKFDRMAAFGAALPRLRARVQRDLALPGLSREKVLATLVHLLDTTYLRIGNDEYARTNGSYGLTTLRDRHADVQGDTLKLKFKGKSGVLHEVSVSDRRIARVVRRCQDLPGQELFQYLDEDGEVRSIGSSDVNDYLREIAGSDFTAKDFRTWHASTQALQWLLPLAASTKAEARRLIKEALTAVSSRLGNTVAVCRKSYVHPRVLECFVAGTLAETCRPCRRIRVPTRLPAAEQRLMLFLALCGAKQP